jgi:hypothetical protein
MSGDPLSTPAILLACEAGSCLLLADAWLARGLSLADINGKITALEEIRAAYPELDGEYDAVVQLFVRDLPPEAAKVQAGHLARKIRGVKEITHETD